MGGWRQRGKEARDGDHGRWLHLLSGVRVMTGMRFWARKEWRRSVWLLWQAYRGEVMSAKELMWDPLPNMI